MRPLLVVLILAVSLTSLANAKGAEFDPTHSDMFVFLEKSEKLQQYGYSGFCENTRTFACSNRLSYKKYLGKRGYFKTMDVVAKAAGYEFREVVLENGKEFYFVAKPYKGNILGIANSDIGFVKEIQAAKSEEGKPLVDGSTVTIIRAERNYGRTSYYVNDGEPFSDQKIDIIRRLLKSLGTREHDEEIVPLLQVSAIDWDRIERRYIFRIAPFFVDLETGPISVSIIKTGNNVQLFQRVQYKADDWLFVKRYVVLAGDERYESSPVDFKRDNSGGKIWEWITLNVNDKQRHLIDAVAAESDAIVRFYGRDYYADKEMSEIQRDALSKMLRLHDLLVELSE